MSDTARGLATMKVRGDKEALELFPKKFMKELKVWDCDFVGEGVIFIEFNTNDTIHPTTLEHLSQKYNVDLKLYVDIEHLDISQNSTHQYTEVVQGKVVEHIQYTKDYLKW